MKDDKGKAEPRFVIFVHFLFANIICSYIRNWSWKNAEIWKKKKGKMVIKIQNWKEEKGRCLSMNNK